MFLPKNRPLTFCAKHSPYCMSINLINICWSFSFITQHPIYLLAKVLYNSLCMSVTLWDKWIRFSLAIKVRLLISAYNLIGPWIGLSQIYFDLCDTSSFFLFNTYICDYFYLMKFSNF